jgi:hypothetical protein
MELIKHMCGQELERGAGRQGAYFLLVIQPMQRRGEYREVQACPNCGEPLCDTECTDLGGTPLSIPNQTEWSKQRRRELGWE